MEDLRFYKRRVSELEEECVKKQNKINELEELHGRMKSRADTWTGYILPRATKKAKELIDNHQYARVRIVAIEDEDKKCSCDKEGEIEKLQKKLDGRKNEIKQIDEILYNVLGVKRKETACPAEFWNLLEEKVNDLKKSSDEKSFVNFIPESPIELASMVINASKE